MDKERIDGFVCSLPLKVVDAMARIDAHASECSLIFIVDDENHLIGCVTDGDIRRWILKAGDLSASVEDFMKRDPIFVKENERFKAREIMLARSITALPIVDDEKIIKDIIILERNGNISKSKKSLKGIPVVIMAGGKGTRLYPYTKILPKPLIPIGATPIVERIIDCYVDYGIDKYFMTVNYKKGMLRSYFNDLDPDYEIVFVEEDKPLGTGGSIKLIEEKFDCPLFVTNCDALIRADYADIYDYHVKNNNDITMVSALKNITVPYGVINSGENGELISMEEKPKLSYFINTGMYVINPETIDLIPDDTMFHMTHLVEKVMANGGKVGTYPISEDSFLDMGEFEEMKRMEQKLNIISEK
ncbi:D-glycero-D-manno-heptose 1-phosphate guanosyltransferase [Anaerovibrio sp. JC8]|uniref:nucleotidyltransferase family protein n=1 Tax=Anaerovibrio sp. JC8 TaxID=1240085 RepID=UPI000A0D3F00|nr:nucleotidyltransferase family protein [Anaerovibrio sp. JC8]ORU01011.1 D-glycero-D-manno-heptose 1-phosphate guanosyltransferase [Anaerovibrio sp. JC8]